MSPAPNRIAQVRLIVLVSVNLRDPELLELLAASGGRPVWEVVKSEIVANLASVSYVETVIASQL